MIERLKNLATTFLDYDSFNMFCFYIDNNYINKARVIIEDVAVTLSNNLINNHMFNKGYNNEVTSFQYSNLTEVDNILTEMVITKSITSDVNVN